MIGVGWLPQYRARIARKSSLAYRRRARPPRRRVQIVAPPVPVVNSELLRFDHGPVEFPLATARPREVSARVLALAGALQRWLVSRWHWLRPRTVPVAVAGLGMWAVVSAAEYLAHYQEEPATSSRVVSIELGR